MKTNHAIINLHRIWKALSGALEWRLRMHIGDDRFDGAIYQAGKNYRPYLKGTVFLGVAGSVGKTTAKDFLVGILGSKGKCIGNPLSRNAAPEVARTILRTRPWHLYCVTELGESPPGTLEKHLAALSPSIALITNVGDDHLSAFGSREAIAREFAVLAHAIPAHGTLVVNDDDELISPLRHEVRCRVISYGTTPNAELQALNVTSDWPEPLQFMVTFDGQKALVRTQLHGRQLLTSALAAIGGGLAAGLTLNECARGIARVLPIEGRMQPVSTPGGITYIRDDFKAPAWTVWPLLENLGNARAKRKIFVLGTVSDCPSKEAEVNKLARAAIAVADIAIFTGPMASAALKGRGPAAQNQLFAFSRTCDVNNFVNSIRQEGDLIVLKGTNKKDHLSRIVLAATGQRVNCWLDDCGRDMFCSDCSHLTEHRGPPGLLATPLEYGPSEESSSALPPSAGPDDQFVIGLGNPGHEFVGTPHNLGYEALDALGAELNSHWAEYADASIAETLLADRRLWLIKLKTPMNLSGSALRRVSRAMGIDADRCILIFDDTDLPLGKVKAKMQGSSGGHRGVASILDAFQTDAFRRVKIGVRSTQTNASSVLHRFDDDTYATIRQSFPIVVAHILRLTAPG